MKILIYLLQVSACTGIFYAFYFLVLRRYTFFTLNRWYLLGTLLISFVIPALQISAGTMPPGAVIKPMLYVQQIQYVAHEAALKPDIKAAEHGFDWSAAAQNVYTAVAIILALQLLFTLLLFASRLRNKVLMRVGQVKVLKGNKKLGNSSFLNVIFINDDELEPDELKQILTHELLHVKLMHSADRLIARIVQIILWFNPFAYCYLRSIEENNEFQVDCIAAKSADKGMYATLLFKLSVSGQSYLFHGFSKVPLKKRIAMLFNKPTSNMKKMIYLLMLPVVAISCLAFAKIEFKPRASVLKARQQTAADTVSRYRQKIKRTPEEKALYNENKKAFDEWCKSDDYNQKQAALDAIKGKVLTFKVEGQYDKQQNVFYGSGYRLTSEGHAYMLNTGYGQAKQLKGKLQAGNVIEMEVHGGSFGKDNPVLIMPAYINRNGEQIFKLAEAEKIPSYPFLYEANKVRFADGQLTSITKYANGKWKSAVVEVVNGYKIKFNIKPSAPEFTGVEHGDHVTFRFVHEAKTGAKEYTVNDWVALSTNARDYGVKNPDFFYQFYEKAE